MKENIQKLLDDFQSKPSNTKKDIEILENKLFIELENVSLMDFLSAKFKVGTLKDYFFSFDQQFIEEVIFEKIILPKDFSKVHLEFMADAVRKNHTKATWIKSVRENISDEDFSHFKNEVEKNIVSLYSLNEVKKELKEINEWKIIQRSGIDIPFYGFLMGMNIFNPNIKKNPKFQISKNDIYKHLNMTENHWKHIAQDKILANRLIFPLLFFRNSTEKSEIKNFIKKHNIELDLDVKIAYNKNDESTIKPIKSVLIKNGIFDFLSTQDRKNLSINDYLFSDVRFKKYVKTKNDFVSLLKKEKDFFSNKKLEEIFLNFKDKKMFYFPIHHSFFLENGEKNLNISIFDGFKENSNSYNFSSKSRFHFIKSVFLKNPYVLNHVKPQATVALFSKVLKDVGVFSESMFLFTQNKQIIDDSGQFHSLIINMTPQKQSDFFNCFLSEYAKIKLHLDEEIKVLVNIFSEIKDKIIIEDINIFNSCMESISNDIALETSNLSNLKKLFNHIYLNNKLSLKEDKKEKLIKI